MYVQINDKGRILATSEDKTSIPDGVEFDFPEDFPWAEMADWKIVSGTLVHDPLPSPPPSPVIELREGQDAQMDALAELGAMADDNALTLDDVLNAVAELGVLVAGEGV